MIICNKCGTKNEDMSRYCLMCGNDLSVSPSSSRLKGNMSGIKVQALKPDKQVQEQNSEISGTKNYSGKGFFVPTELGEGRGMTDGASGNDPSMRVSSGQHYRKQKESSKWLWPTICVLAVLTLVLVLMLRSPRDNAVPNTPAATQFVNEENGKEKSASKEKTSDKAQPSKDNTDAGGNNNQEKPAATPVQVSDNISEKLSAFVGDWYSGTNYGGNSYDSYETGLCIREVSGNKIVFDYNEYRMTGFENAEAEYDLKTERAYFSFSGGYLNGTVTGYLAFPNDDTLQITFTESNYTYLDAGRTVSFSRISAKRENDDSTSIWSGSGHYVVHFVSADRAAQQIKVNIMQPVSIPDNIVESLSVGSRIVDYYGADSEVVAIEILNAYNDMSSGYSITEAGFTVNNLTQEEKTRTIIWLYGGDGIIARYDNGNLYWVWIDPSCAPILEDGELVTLSLPNYVELGSNYYYLCEIGREKVNLYDLIDCANGINPSYNTISGKNVPVYDYCFEKLEIDVVNGTVTGGELYWHP